MIINRRQFSQSLLAAASLMPMAHVARAAAARSPSTALSVGTRTLDINGKSATVYSLTRSSGSPGLELTAGQHVNVTLANQLAEPTMVHWHGLTPAIQFDGAPDMPLPLLQAGETRQYFLPAGASGTHWMHAHTLQEQNLLAAPLIVRDPADLTRDEQDVVILLHDFSFTPAAELMARLTGGTGMDHGKMDHSMMGHDMSKMDMSQMDHGAMMAMDLNDIEYDAYLANDRTLNDPEVVQVEKATTVRLRIINGASATGFTIDTGALPAEVIAVDGQPVLPLAARRFPLAMGQRVDMRLAIPAAGGAYPILALREGAHHRTGIILATAGASIAKLADQADAKGPVLTLGEEAQLQSAMPLNLSRAVDRELHVRLTGSMQPYQWQMQSAGPLQVHKGERVVVHIENQSMMSHPMHLHGHHFQVVGMNGKPMQGAMRDTVLVPPMARVSLAFDANNPAAQWPFHCHHLYHMVTGMMGSLRYSAR